MTASSTRNREKTRQKLIAAVGSLIARNGFPGLGVNAVAQEAGVDKVLIYRYFGSLEGLIDAFLQQRDYWVRSNHYREMDLSALALPELRALLKEIFTGQLRELLQEPEILELNRWELLERNEITDRIAGIREEMGTAILKRYLEVLRCRWLDLPAVTALLIGGIHYLVLRSKTADVFNTVPLSGPEGWRRLEDGIGQIVDMIFDNIEHHNSGNQ